MSDDDLDPWADDDDDLGDDDDFLLEPVLVASTPKPKGKFKRPPVVKVVKDEPKPKKVRIPKAPVAPRPVAPVSELAPGESPTIGRAIISGHCNTPQTDQPHLSHERCARNRGGSDASPGRRTWYPCPCGCHLEEERFECGACGATIARSLYWTGDGNETYVHVDPVTGRSRGEEC